MAQELKNHRMETTKDLILQVFCFLEEQYSYTHIFQEKMDDTFIEYLQVTYINEVKHREVTISYTSGKVYDEIRYTFTITITRTPYSDLEDFFSLSEYLQSKGKDFSTNIVKDFNEQEAEKILEKLAVSIKENALEIIEGNQWSGEYYPRKD